MQKRIYLAGPIAGLTFNTADKWRTTVAELIETRSDGRIVCFSPLRSKRPLFEASTILTSQHRPENPLTTAKGIMTRDYTDCIKADLVFANFLGAKQISMGTVMEMGFAFAHRVPVVAVIDDGNPHANHVMMEESFNYRVSTLQDAVEVALSFLLP